MKIFAVKQRRQKEKRGCGPSVFLPFSQRLVFEVGEKCSEEEEKSRETLG